MRRAYGAERKERERDNELPVAPKVRYVRGGSEEFDPSGPLIGQQDRCKLANVTGEGRLMLAIVGESFMDLTRQARCYGGGKTSSKSLAWFLAEDWGWPFSFVRICEALDLDAERIRKNALQIYHESLSRHAEGSTLRLLPKRGSLPKRYTHTLNRTRPLGSTR